MWFSSIDGDIKAEFLLDPLVIYAHQTDYYRLGTFTQVDDNYGFSQERAPVALSAALYGEEKNQRVRIRSKEIAQDLDTHTTTKLIVCGV